MKREFLAALFLLALCGSALAAEKTRSLEILASNLNEENPRDIEINLDLPYELGRGDVLSTDGLQLEYNEEKRCWAVKGKVLLQPSETTLFRVVTRDVWNIPEKEILRVKKALVNASPDDLKKLNDIERHQKETADLKTRIALYREDIATLEKLKHDAGATAVNKKKPLPLRALLIALLGLLTLAFIARILANVLRSRAAPEKEKMPLDLPSAEPPALLDKNVVPDSPEMPADTIDLKNVPCDAEAIEKVAPNLVKYFKCVPVRLEPPYLVVAVGVPSYAVKDNLSQCLGIPVKLVKADENDVMESIKRHYGIGAEIVEKIFKDKPRQEGQRSADRNERSADITKSADDASVIALVNQILVDAQSKGASDIHFEPNTDGLKLRYRIDGFLYDAAVPKNMSFLASAMVSRIKIMSGLNVIERRRPQDGKAEVRIKDESFDLRVSSLPTPYGESLVIRILPAAMLLNLEKLGFLERDWKLIESLIHKPNGIIFVTGPTGSGKTTTLYASLNKIRRERAGVKILTIEDPIEYELAGITQMQVNPEIDFNFAEGLRSMLRHDPDIMMIGEVRDFETAEIAIRMALTGHLLFSTLHTNDAVGGIARLLDMGIEPYLLASSLEAFVAQRLVRTLCPHCKVKVAGQGLYRPGTCEECRFTGYKGRTALFEILSVDAEIRNLISSKASADEIKRTAMAKGMRTLVQDGEEKIALGLTTWDEVLQVAQKS